MKRILPTNDLAFRKVLSSEDTKDILSGLIKDFFGFYVPEDEIKIENPYSIEAYKEFLKGGESITSLRETIKDVSASFPKANFVSELQIRKSKFFNERAIFYPLDRFCKNYNRAGHMQINSGGKPNRYSSLRPVYSLNILGYNHYDDEDALRIFELYDPKRNKKYGKELLLFGFFELNKQNIETQAQRYWRDYFLTGEAKPEAPDYIKKASRIIEVVNLNEEEAKMITLLEKAQADYDAGMSDAFFEGKESKAEEMATLMLNDGESYEKIIRYTGLTMEDIKNLHKKF